MLPLRLAAGSRLAGSSGRSEQPLAVRGAAVALGGQLKVGRGVNGVAEVEELAGCGGGDGEGVAALQVQGQGRGQGQG